MQGIDKERVEQMEARLKEDILREAERYAGAIMVNHETDDGQIFDAWEPVCTGAVQTPLEVYDCLVADGYNVEYARVPITDGKAPKSSDCGTLASRIAAASQDTAFVFNCQASPTEELFYVLAWLCGAFQGFCLLIESLLTFLFCLSDGAWSHNNWDGYSMSGASAV